MLVPIAAATFGAATVVIATSREGNTYAAASTGVAIADLAAGLGLLAAGTLRWRDRTSGSSGPLTMLLGVAWLAPDWVGWDGGWAVARSLGMVVSPFLIPLALHLVLALPTGKVVAPAARVTVGVAYVVTSIGAAVRAAVRDPFLDLYCWSNCTDNVFLIHADLDLARDIDAFLRWFSLIAGVLVLVVASGRLVRARPAERRMSWFVLVPTGLSGAAGAMAAAALIIDPAEDPDRAIFTGVFLASAVVLGCLAAGIAWSALRGRAIGVAIGRLAGELGEAPPPGALGAALARSLGDDTVEVSYWLPTERRYVDATGLPVTPAPGPGRAGTPIVRAGEPVAMVVHDAALLGSQTFQEQLGAAARLAVDNERLRAQVMARLEDLRASRARIVEAGDDARRRIERDLHDGAQQRLLALSYELRLASAAARKEGDVELARILDAACEEAHQALEELRELAHGIHPAILTEAGLDAALRTLAEEASLPVEIVDVPAGRFPRPVERAAYVVVSGAIDAAARAGADHVEVVMQVREAMLVVSVGPVAWDPLAHLSDRVGALGGRLALEGETLRAELPCA